MSGASGPRRGSAMGDIHVIPNGALLISDGVIQHVGTTRRVERLAEARKADEIDASGRVVIPGLVDCFTQILCGPPRGFGDDAAAGGADAFTVSARIYRSWSSQRLEMEGRKRLRQFVRYGATTVAGSSGYGLDEETELRSLRAMDRLRGNPVDLAPLLYTSGRAWQRGQSNPWVTLEKMATELLPLAHGKRLLSGLVIGEGFSEDAMEGYAACAARFGLPVTIETSSGEVAGLVSRAGTILAVMDLETLDPASAALEALAAGGAVSVLLPGRSFHAGRSTFAPARALIDRGAAVALATGFDTLASPTASLPMIMALACKQMHMTPEEALTATTINAAHALGIGSRTGSLQYGMQADLVVMDCGDYREIPLYFGMNPVAMVMRRGETIFPRLESTTHEG